MLDNWIKFFKAHERALLVIVTLFVLYFGALKITDKIAQIKHDNLIVAQQVLATQDAANKEKDAYVQSELAKLNAVMAANDKQIALLEASVEKRDTATAQKVAEVKAPATTQQAVDDLNTAYNLPAPVTVTATGVNVPPQDIPEFTVAKIEHDTLQADLADTKTQLDDTRATLTQAQSVITAQQADIEGLKKARVDVDAAHKKEIAAIKAADRKSKLKWFGAGYAAGFISGVALRVGVKL